MKGRRGGVMVLGNGGLAPDGMDVGENKIKGTLVELPLFIACL